MQVGSKLELVCMGVSRHHPKLTTVVKAKGQLTERENG
ncbi:hypothetical protein EMIT0P258_60203 [Pseudomonas sp. IT-P258]